MPSAHRLRSNVKTEVRADGTPAKSRQLYALASPGDRTMTASGFRRLALALPEAVEGSHFGNPDFRIGGKIFATLSLQKEGYGRADAVSGTTSWHG